MAVEERPSATGKSNSLLSLLKPYWAWVGALVLLTIVGIAGWWVGVTTLFMAWATTLVLMLTAAWEWFSLHGGWQRWVPWLGRIFGADPVKPA